MNAIQNLLVHLNKFDIVTVGGLRLGQATSPEFERVIFQSLATVDINKLGTHIGNPLHFQTFCESSTIRELHLDDYFYLNPKSLQHLNLLKNSPQLVSYATPNDAVIDMLSDLKLDFIETNNDALDQLLLRGNHLRILYVKDIPLILKSSELCIIPLKN